MLEFNPTISIIKLNVNGLNTPFKRQRFFRLDKKQEPTILPKRNIQTKYKSIFKYKAKKPKKVKGWKKIYNAKTNQKKARVAMLISDN